MGFSEPAIRVLEKIADFITAQQNIEAAQAAIASQGDAIDAANTDISAANDAINVLDGRIDAYDALAPFVQQDSAAAPSFAGQTISASPTQTEVQNIDDAVAGLITALQAANVLT